MNRKDLAFYFIGKKYGFDIKQYLNFVFESQFWDKNKIEEYKNIKFKEIIDHAYTNVPYYKNLMDEYGFKPSDFKETSDIKKLPVLRKATIKANFSDFLAKDFRSYHPIDRYTGGTTGAAFHLYNDMNSWAINWATKMRTFSWGGYEFGKDRIGVMAGGSLLPTKKMALRNRLWRFLNNYYSMPITQMNDQILEGYVQNIKRQDIKFLRGYPSAIYTFALYLKQINKKVRLNAVFTTAEMLHEHQRELIEDRFDCKCFDQYGCADGMGGASECNHHMGLHIHHETSLLNIVDKNGDDTLPEMEGEIVLTSFNDRAMPLIRYAPGDIAIKHSIKCSCGRDMPLIKKIIGRSSDLIFLSNGNTLNGLSIPFEAWSEKIERFQIIQTEPDSVEVLLIKKKSFNKADEKQVIDMMQFNCGEGIKINVRYVDEIPVPKSGKFRYVISLVNQPAS